LETPEEESQRDSQTGIIRNRLVETKSHQTSSELASRNKKSFHMEYEDKESKAIF